MAEKRDEMTFVALHPVCSSHHLGLSEKLHALGAALAEEAVTPIYATCCAFAEDRGFLHPELTHSAISEQVNELAGRRFDAYLSSNRTCEIGMNLATGQTTARSSCYSRNSPARSPRHNATSTSATPFFLSFYESKHC